MIFENNPLKEIQFKVIQEAKQEINQLSSNYKLFGNLNYKSNIYQLIEQCSKRFLDLINLKQTDHIIIDYIDYINMMIAKEYSKQFDNINSDIIITSNIKVLNQIMRTFTNLQNDDLFEEEESDDEKYGRFATIASDFESFSEEEEIIEEKYEQDNIELIQKKINIFLDKNTDTFIFNSDKLREISLSKSKLSEMLTSLKSIKRHLRSRLHYTKVEKPHSYVLYSSKDKSFEHNKPISDILNGNCFFVSLYGHPEIVRKVLIKLTNDKTIEKHSINDLISIYGPLDIITFSKNVQNSFEKVKQFNINTPNIYFFEISNEENDTRYIQWCNFIALISHITVFCSEKYPTSEEAQKVKDLLFDETETNFLFECFNVNQLDESILRDVVFENLINKIDLFIPDITANHYHLLIKENETISSLQTKRKQLENDKMDDYSKQILDMARDNYNEIKRERFRDLFLMTKKAKYVDDFHLDKNELIYSALQFFYVNTNQKFWNNDYVIKTSGTLVKEIETSFNSTFNQTMVIEKVGHLINLILKCPETLSNESNEVFNKLVELCPKEFGRINVPESSKEIEEFKQILIEKYDYLVHKNFYDIIQDDFLENITNELFSFLFENPIASDKEYGIFYSNLYKNKIKSNDIEMVKRCFNVVSHDRKVISDYKVKEFMIIIDKESFKSTEINFDETSYLIDLTPSTTCHELYEIVKNNFTLGNIPFSISYLKNDTKYHSFDVEIFDNSFPISKIKSDSFKVTHNNHCINKSTYSFIQSMIVMKEIKIADDFIIRTSSKESEFTVSYPRNHKGWLDVSFDIKTPNPEKSFGEDGGVLIYLKLVSSEIDILKEGNSLIHQSFHDNKWIDEPDPVFLSYPKCNTAVFLLRNCSTHRIKKVTTSVDSMIPDAKKDKRYSRDWEGFDAKKAYKRGGRPYYLPVGYQGEGILVDNFIRETCVAFHGTNAIDVPKIINNGFILPRQRGGVQKNRFHLGEIYNGVKDWANAIFVSPSIKYAAKYSTKEPIIAYSKKHTYVQSGHVYHKCIRIIVLQVRVNPKKFRVYGSTINVDTVGDPYNYDEMEWRIKNPKYVFPYRLLIRDVSQRIYEKDYRPHCD